MKNKIAIIGGGNIGSVIAKGLVESGKFSPADIIITRRKVHCLKNFQKKGFTVTSDNIYATRSARIVIISVLPQQLKEVLREIKSVLSPHSHTLISTVTGVKISEILKHTVKNLPVARVMPNTAVLVRESMTCISGNSKKALKTATEIFNLLGKTVILPEELMVPATALCACGVAFFMRAIRAASQGGIQIGFHPDEALYLSAQTAKGATSLLLKFKNHPESEIDRVTTPRGCTIAGLNEMEHQGFSSAMIRGIVVSTEKAETLYKNEEK